jgi:hypothetical protein
MYKNKILLILLVVLTIVLLWIFIGEWNNYYIEQMDTSENANKVQVQTTYLVRMPVNSNNLIFLNGNLEPVKSKQYATEFIKLNKKNSDEFVLKLGNKYVCMINNKLSFCNDLSNTLKKISVPPSVMMPPTSESETNEMNEGLQPGEHREKVFLKNSNDMTDNYDKNNVYVIYDLNRGLSLNYMSDSLTVEEQKFIGYDKIFDNFPMKMLFSKRKVTGYPDNISLLKNPIFYDDKLNETENRDFASEFVILAVYDHNLKKRTEKFVIKHIPTNKYVCLPNNKFSFCDTLPEPLTGSQSVSRKAIDGTRNFYRDQEVELNKNNRGNRISVKGGFFVNSNFNNDDYDKTTMFELLYIEDNLIDPDTLTSDEKKLIGYDKNSLNDGSKKFIADKLKKQEEQKMNVVVENLPKKILFAKRKVTGYPDNISLIQNPVFYDDNLNEIEDKDLASDFVSFGVYDKLKKRIDGVVIKHIPTNKYVCMPNNKFTFCDTLPEPLTGAQNVNIKTMNDIKNFHRNIEQELNKNKKGSRIVVKGGFFANSNLNNDDYDKSTIFETYTENNLIDPDTLTADEKKLMGYDKNLLNDESKKFIADKLKNQTDSIKSDTVFVSIKRFFHNLTSRKK